MAELTNKDIIEHIEKMSVMDLAELVKKLEEKFGVSAAAPIAVAAGGAGMAAPKEAEEEKQDYEVVLTSFGDKKINVIKVVREVVEGLGLKEAKEMVDGVPSKVKEGLNKEEADLLKKKFEEVGAQVEVK
jgi:large subunit ribosomal protein L7/L12